MLAALMSDADRKLEVSVSSYDDGSECGLWIELIIRLSVGSIS